jgi:nucleoside-diphosphate-sugar epimerase
VALRMAVVGGRGWLGRQIAGAAAARGLVVTIVSRRPVGRRADRLPRVGHVAVDRSSPFEPVIGVSDRIGLVPVDLSDPTELGAVLGSYDVVVNAAGCRSGAPDELAAANTLLADRLGALAAGGGWRLVHLGSAAEYGRLAAGPDPIAEDRWCRPETGYARTKLAGTEAVVRWRDRGARATVARVFNVVGADLPAHNPVHGLALQARALLAGGEGEIAVGDPTTERDLCGLTWVAEAVVALALRPAAPVPAPATGSPVGVGRVGRVGDAAARARARWGSGRAPDPAGARPEGAVAAGPSPGSGPDAVDGAGSAAGPPGGGAAVGGGRDRFRPGGPADGPASGPAVVNVCSGRGTTFGELALALAAEVGADACVRDLGWPRGGRIVGDPALLRSLVTLPAPPTAGEMARATLAEPPPRPTVSSPFGAGRRAARASAEDRGRFR